MFFCLPAFSQSFIFVFQNLRPSLAQQQMRSGSAAARQHDSLAHGKQTWREMAKKNFEKLEWFIDQKLETHLSQRVICRDIQVHGHQQVGFELTALTNKLETAGTINPQKMSRLDPVLRIGHQWSFWAVSTGYSSCPKENQPPRHVGWPGNPTRCWPLRVPSCANSRGNLRLPGRATVAQCPELLSKSEEASRNHQRRQSPSRCVGRSSSRVWAIWQPSGPNKVGHLPCHRCPPCWSTILRPVVPLEIATPPGWPWFGCGPWKHLLWGLGYVHPCQCLGLPQGWSPLWPCSASEWLGYNPWLWAVFSPVFCWIWELAWPQLPS